MILRPIGFLLVMLVFLWAYDEKLQPCDDLLPLPPRQTDPAKNGYFFLEKRWANQPEIAVPTKPALQICCQAKILGTRLKNHLAWSSEHHDAPALRMSTTINVPK